MSEFERFRAVLRQTITEQKISSIIIMVWLFALVILLTLWGSIRS